MYQTKPDASTNPAPLDPRLHRKCEVAVIKAVNAFPDILAKCEPDAAAAVIARLIHILLCRPGSGEQADPLAVFIRTLHEMEEREASQPEH